MSAARSVKAAEPPVSSMPGRIAERLRVERRAHRRGDRVGDGIGLLGGQASVLYRERRRVTSGKDAGGARKPPVSVGVEECSRCTERNTNAEDAIGGVQTDRFPVALRDDLSCRVDARLTAACTTPPGHVSVGPPGSTRRRPLVVQSPALVVHSREGRIAGIARTEPVCLDPGTVRSPAVQASLSVDRRRDPARSAIVRELASPAGRAVVLRVRHGVQPFSLCCVRAGGRGREPRAVSRPGRVHQEGA